MSKQKRAIEDVDESASSPSNKRGQNNQGQPINRVSTTASDSELEYYLNCKSSDITKEVDIQAFEKAYPNVEDRIAFMRSLLLYQQARVEVFKDIEKRFPTNRSHPKYFKIQTWKKDNFTISQRVAKALERRLEDQISDLEDRMNEKFLEEREADS